ncbi:MAG TPA: hypothetical protein VFD19_04675, partial [Clostridia bacterium]|nr:hypothetical protein [Clostridia bacterium]
IRDSILPLEEVAFWLSQRLWDLYPVQMAQRYGQDDGHEQDPHRVFENAAMRMGCQSTEGRADLTRFSGLLLEDFRNGRIGRITIEWPAKEEKAQ